MTDELLFNPFDPAFRADPVPFYARLRAEAPCYRTPLGTYVVSRYDDVARTLRSPAFSRDIDTAREEYRPRRAVMQRLSPGREVRKSILNLDPPDHTRLRGLVAKAFTPRAIERLRPRIEQLVDARLDAMAEQAAGSGTVELVDALAFPVPFDVISELLDMPTDRIDEVRAWSVALTQALEPTASDDQLRASMAASDAMGAYVAAVAEERRRNPGDDVLSALIAVEEAGDRLSPVELVTMVVLLYVAGHETTVNLIGNGVLALLRHPDELRRWQADPSLAPRAVDELLRYDGPVQLTVRIPKEPQQYGDVTVDAGIPVTTLLGSANHDPDAFVAPDRLDLTRTDAGRHLAFAAGIHFCLGSSLARAEAEIAIGRLITRFPRLELAAPPVWRDRLTIRGVSELHLALHG